MKFIKELIKLFKYYRSPRVIILLCSDTVYIRLLAEEKDIAYDYFYSTFSSIFLVTDIVDTIIIYTTKEYVDTLTDRQLEYLEDNHIVRYLD